MTTRADGRRPIDGDRQGFNGRWHAANLRAVHRPATIEDVAVHVEEALGTHGRNVKVVSGRHCYEDFVFNDETQAIIDMASLDAAGYDRDADAYYIDAGCTIWTAYLSLLNGHGKTIPAGTCGSVGAGGHISGAGYGLLSRLHGLTVDHLSAVDIVTWDAASGRARLRRVSPTNSDHAERDLFWALCGAGGGNFGVIVRYWFASLPEAPTRATHWTLTWDWLDLTPRTLAGLLEEFTDLAASLPLEQHASLHLDHAATGHAAMFLQIVSSNSPDSHARRAARAVDGLRRRFSRIARPVLRSRDGQPAFRRVPPTRQNMLDLTYRAALTSMSGSGPRRSGKHKSAYMRRGFPPEQVDAIHQWLNRTPPGSRADELSQSMLQVSSYGGAVNSRASDATPVPQRSSILKLQYQTYWDSGSLGVQRDSGAARAQEESHLEWIRGFYRDVYAAYGGSPDATRDPSGTMDGCYYNYPDADLGTRTDGLLDHALGLYFGANLRTNPRNLVAVKQRWDPRDYFNHAQSIPVS